MDVGTKGQWVRSPDRQERFFFHSVDAEMYRCVEITISILVGFL
jgi:hypothetical protein